MKKSILLFCLSLWIPISMFATIHRVNNSGIAADFTTFASALAAAITGDTIHLEPSGVSYGNIGVTKRVVVIGNGYFLDQNLDLQQNTGTSKVGLVTFYPSGSGSKVSGLEISGDVSLWPGLVSDITVERCYITGRLSITSNRTGDDILFDGCYFKTTVDPIGLSTTLALEVLFNNCYIEGRHVSLNTNASGIFNNCVINLTGSLIVSNYDFTSSILTKGTMVDNGGNTYQNNLCDMTQFPTGNGNVQNVDMSTVFEGYPTQGGNTDDGRFILAASSPAEGAGVGGEDCGIFGGAGPYKLSGIPPVPTIYDIIAPGSAGATLNVTISTRVNN